MATPTNQEADEARWFFQRERRRTLQNLSDFKTAGYVPPSGTPFDFGAVSGNSQSPNSLLLPADIEIALEFSALVPNNRIGIVDLTTGETIRTIGPGQAGGRIPVSGVFREEHSIAIFRFIGIAAGTLKVYFAGPKSQLTQIGVATFI